MPDLRLHLVLLLLTPGLVYCGKLEDLRKKLVASDLAAYIIPNSDYHGSEVPGARDKRREWLSGFSGTWGDAVVTRTSAALFTDTRYTIQAKRQLTKDWQVPNKDVNITRWLSENLSKGDKIGADPKTISFKLWLDIQNKVNASGVELIATDENFIDELWTDRPGLPEASLFVHDIKYTGQNYSCKVLRVREKMASRNSSVLVLSSLEEIAWLLNLRGGDSPYTPVFASFLLLTPTDGTLYLRRALATDEIAMYLNSSETPFRIKDIEDFWSDWNETTAECTRCFVPTNTNYFIYSAVEERRRFTERSPVVDLRAFKTAAEVESSRLAHISDAIALCILFMTLEEKVEDRRWKETELSTLVGDLREEQPENRGRSFPDIVAAGANAALPHYIPVQGADSFVNTSTVILIDSGGQYLGGTTDVTRVLHLGTPRPVEVDVYTRLLKGVARLGLAVFPEGSQVRALDSILRAPLYEAGLGYGHGSTHGTGVFLAVHEEFNGTYYENFIGSQEPGFYEENDFGMRLENLVVVVPAETIYKNKTEKRLLKFSPLTLVPYERKLINASILDESELNWLNKYHHEVLKVVGGEIKHRGDQKLYQWLAAKTAPIVKK